MNVLQLSEDHKRHLMSPREKPPLWPRKAHWRSEKHPRWRRRNLVRNHWSRDHNDSWAQGESPRYVKTTPRPLCVGGRCSDSSQPKQHFSQAQNWPKLPREETKTLNPHHRQKRSIEGKGRKTSRSGTHLGSRYPRWLANLDLVKSLTVSGRCVNFTYLNIDCFKDSYPYLL